MLVDTPKGIHISYCGLVLGLVLVTNPHSSPTRTRHELAPEIAVAPKYIIHPLVIIVSLFMRKQCAANLSERQKGKRVQKFEIRRTATAQQ